MTEQNEQITIAMAKGRLAEQTMELMEGMGIDVSPLREKSRKLVFESADGKYRYIMVKPSDVPTYVDHGVADAVSYTHLDVYKRQIHIFALCGEHDDGHVGFLTDALTDFDPVHHRQHHVQQDQINVVAAEFFKRFRPVVGGQYLVSVLFQ